MSRILRRRPSAGLVVALVALFVALGSGGAYAAFKLPTNSVGSQQLKNHSVGPAKLTTWVDAQLNKVSKLNTGKSGTDGTNGAAGQSGPAGATGTTGPQGPQGAQGAQGRRVRRAQQGLAGQQGTQGPQGQAGAASLLTWTYGNIQVPDTSGDCGNDWATDTYDTAMEVTPQANGSYLVTKYLTGFIRDDRRHRCSRIRRRAAGSAATTPRRMVSTAPSRASRHGRSGPDRRTSIRPRRAPRARRRRPASNRTPTS